MTTTRQFLTKIDDYNARVYAAETKLRALQKEHEVLRTQASDFMRVSQFDAEIATFTLPRFTFPEGYAPPEKPSGPTPGEPAGGEIIRRDAAE